MQRLYADDLGSVLQHPAALAARDTTTLESNATHVDAEDPWHDRHFYEASTMAASQPLLPQPTPHMAEPAATLAKSKQPPNARSTHRNVILIILAVVIVLAGIGLAWYLWTSSGSMNGANENRVNPLQRVRNLWAAKAPSRAAPLYAGVAEQDESDTPPLRQPRRIVLEPQPPPSHVPLPPPSPTPPRSVSFAPDVERIYYSDEESGSEISSSAPSSLPLVPPANVLPGAETRGRPEMARSVAVDADVDHLYTRVGGGGSGGGNKVLGSADTVRALQQAGAGGISAEQIERSAYDPDADPTRDPYTNARRSMGSLYEKEMSAAQQHGGADDDDVTLDELGIHSADDEYAASRQRSKVMAQASAAAVGRIYDTVQRQRGGAKDVPFVNPDAGIDYINVHTQQPLSALTE